jgi:protein-tyrosine phosphatase
MKYGWDLEEISGHFNTVISLVDMDSRPIVETGMEHVSVPCREFHEPTAIQMGDMNHVLDGMDRTAKKGWPVPGGPPYLFHCYNGRGRTCTALASRLVWRGNTNAISALAKVQKVCPAMNVTKAQMKELVCLGMWVKQLKARKDKSTRQVRQTRQTQFEIE